MFNNYIIGLVLVIAGLNAVAYYGANDAFMSSNKENIEKLETRIEIMEKTFNSMFLDGTPFQTNDFTRGQDDASKSLIHQVNLILDGKDTGEGYNFEPWGQLRRRLLSMMKLLESNRTEIDSLQDVVSKLERKLLEKDLTDT